MVSGNSLSSKLLSDPGDSHSVAKCCRSMKLYVFPIMRGNEVRIMGGLSKVKAAGLMVQADDLSCSEDAL